MRIRNITLSDYGLTKGQTFSAGRIALLSGVRPDEDRYWQVLLQTRDILQSCAADQLDEIWTVQCRNGGLYICLDAEAIEVNHRRFQNAIGRMRNANELLRGVDLSNLSADERHRYDAVKAQQAPLIQGISRVRRVA
jgi:hypothetical protein